MKLPLISIFSKATLMLFCASFCMLAAAQTLMTGTAKDGTVLSFTALRDLGDNTELVVKRPQQKTVKKYLIYTPIIDGQITFAEAINCQRNCANAKSVTPGLPLKGGYLRVGDELRCIKNCKGIENGLIFVAQR